jgi:hypothetical protein
MHRAVGCHAAGREALGRPARVAGVAVDRTSAPVQDGRAGPDPLGRHQDSAHVAFVSFRFSD